MAKNSEKIKDRPLSQPEPADNPQRNKAAAAMPAETNTRKLLIRYGLSFLLMIAILYPTLKILIKQYSWHEILESLSGANYLYIALGFALMFLYQICIASSLFLLLNAFMGVRTPYYLSLQTAFVGFYFNNITPSATGGQPMEVLFLHRRGIQAGHASLIFIIMSFNFYLVMFIYAAFSFIWDYDFIMGSLGHVEILLYIGLIFNGVVGICCFLIIYKPIIIRNLVKGVMNLLIRLRLIRHPKRHFRRISKFLTNYAQGSSLFWQNRPLVLKLILLHLVQVGALFSIPFVVCKALGTVAPKLFLTTFNLQSVLYMAVSSMPTPGAVGLTESGFVTMFESILPESKVMAAMILTRVINLYGFLIISAVMTLWAFTVSTKRKPINLEGNGNRK